MMARSRAGMMTMIRRCAAALLALAVLAAPAAATAAELGALWRGGLARADELFRHAQMAPVLAELLGGRQGDFARAAVTPDLLTRHMGQIIVGTACAEPCAAGGVFVVADTRRGEVMVVLAAPGRSGAARFERFTTPGFPFPSETVYAALEKWQARYAR